ncbi:HEAT repeat domain-containing protein [Naasia sp. SYSU D00057]|uniref:HEAT repeat domain-containing protein n=1 Tax=Naasia sp. SYSU D00057 TaxID=2817380 RepID=UPI001B312977|nr:MerR family transcriptional regulator [Naasia sp. SYSU D00057]
MLIGEVARRSGVSARMLRHYESLGLVRPTGRSVGGYREYSSEDIRRIFEVESLRSLGLSLREVGRALDDPGFAPAALVRDLVRSTEERIARENELLSRLRRVESAGPDAWEEVLRIVALLQALGSDSAGRRLRAALDTADGSAPSGVLAEAVLGESDPNVAGALRWALARSDGGGLDLLGVGLDSSDPEVRERAVRSIAKLPGEDATELLRRALTSSDLGVRRSAALALGVRGVPDAVPTLLAMVLVGISDVDAADALSALARRPELADGIAAGLVDPLDDDALDPAARRRIAQALADIPGAAATAALGRLQHDDDRAVALTARYLFERRTADPGSSE